jgi:nucleotide-binding universal stress UspA family protein
MFKHCLICTDFTDGLQRIVHFVSDLGKGGFEKVTFLHSVPIWEQGEIPRVDQEKIEEAKQKLSPALNNIPEGMTVNVEVLSGQAHENILQVVNKYDIDFVITGTPLTSSWQNLLFGSTTAKLTKTLDVPIMILRPQLISVYRDEELALRLANLNSYWLISYQNQVHDHALIQKIKDYAAEKSHQFVPKCLVMTVVEDVSRSSLLIESHIKEAEIQLHELQRELQSVGVEVETLVVKGNRLEQLFKSAVTYNISAIAIANDRDHNVINRILNFTVGSESEHLLNCSWFPLIYFPIK